MPGVPRTIVAFALLAAAATIVIATSAVAQTFIFPPGAQNGGVAIYAPAPVYPAGAGARGARGVGVYVMRVEIKTGRVKGVGIVRSTGHKDLDAAAIQALTNWRFRPYGRLRSIKQLFPGSNDPLAEKDALVQTPVTFH